MAAYEQRDLLPTYAEFTANVCEDAGEGFSRLGETMPRRSEIWPQPMGHHIFLWRISHVTGNEHFALCRNTFGDAPYGAAVYSVNTPEADRLVHLEENRYPMQRYTLVGRMYGIDYPDPSAWESRRKEESERESSMKVFTVALIGAGNRGEIYTDIMKTLPENFALLPLLIRTRTIAETFRISTACRTITFSIPGRSCWRSQGLPILRSLRHKTVCIMNRP